MPEHLVPDIFRQGKSGGSTRFQPVRHAVEIAVRPRRARPQQDGDHHEPHTPSKPTTRLAPSRTSRDPRPLPEELAIQSALTALFEMLGDTRLEPDLEDLL